jgi:hypothetical protein
MQSSSPCSSGSGPDAQTLVWSPAWGSRGIPALSCSIPAASSGWSHVTSYRVLSWKN